MKPISEGGVGGIDMSSNLRTNHLARVFVVAAMVWGLAVPVIHLACGMTMADTVVLCEEHDAATHRSAQMDDNRSDGHAHHHPGHEGAAFHQHQHATDLGSLDIESSEAFLECCLFEYVAADHRAQLVSLSQVPTPVAAQIDAPVAVDPTETATPNESTSSPPVAFRVLFSVFLI